jgi:hypothetical protein
VSGPIMLFELQALSVGHAMGTLCFQLWLERSGFSEIGTQCVSKVLSSDAQTSSHTRHTPQERASASLCNVCSQILSASPSDSSCSDHTALFGGAVASAVITTLRFAVTWSKLDFLSSVLQGSLIFAALESIGTSTSRTQHT